MINYVLLQASGAFPDTTLATTTDLAPAGTGLDLSLTRIYSSSLLNRDNPGVFGDGWTFTYGISAVTDASGNVYIVSPSGAEFFTRQPDGTYLPPANDGSTLTLVGGAYVHTDTAGTVEKFLPSGQLSSITDSNGNTIDLGYDVNGVISGVASSNGQSLTFTTNAEGRITSATDQTGRQTTYSYDASGNHLVSVSGPLGTTAYSYDASLNPETQNALTQIANPDGTTQTFQDDGEGDLTSAAISGDGQINVQLSESRHRHGNRRIGERCNADLRCERQCRGNQRPAWERHPIPIRSWRATGPARDTGRRHILV